ncbi:MAG: hypothetical protein AMS23_04160 [Bacteroides sp. SM1_62]|nr:MAG: hypothetical protein AMS26_03560 [Bacteroides sp. SM23_62]KPL25880.1 MAG: hypothetical protein AMS23_04160 [Bacteroides sp. SM1_62]
MGSRFGDIKGYNEDASLNPEYLGRMAKIIEACDQRNMIMPVGCLYWGNSKGKWDHWDQQDAENAVAKEQGLYGGYINVGIYTEGKKAEQLQLTDNLLKNGCGYIFASTWLQNVPPNHHPGGNVTYCDPGIKWWLEYIRENYWK